MEASCPHTFFLGSHNSQVLLLVTRGLLPHILKSILKICLHSTQLYGVLKNRKRRIFLVSLKLSAIWGNLTLHHSCLPLPKNTSFLQFGQVKNIHGYLFEKIFLVCFSLLSPQAEQKEADEQFANHLQIYVSRTFTKAKKSVICAEYPMSSKFHSSKLENIFHKLLINSSKLRTWNI